MLFKGDNLLKILVNEQIKNLLNDSISSFSSEFFFDTNKTGGELECGIVFISEFNKIINKARISLVRQIEQNKYEEYFSNIVEVGSGFEFVENLTNVQIKCNFTLLED